MCVYVCMCITFTTFVYVAAWTHSTLRFFNVILFVCVCGGGGGGEETGPCPLNFVTADNKNVTIASLNIRERDVAQR